MLFTINKLAFDNSCTYEQARNGATHGIVRILLTLKLTCSTSKDGKNRKNHILAIKDMPWESLPSSSLFALNRKLLLLKV